MYQMLVKEVMRRDVVVTGPDRLIAEAADLMEQYNVRRLPVVDEDGCLQGIVTDDDVLEAETAESVLSNYDPDVNEDWVYVSDVMSRDVVTVSPETSLGELAGIFIRHKIGGVPVVEMGDENSRCRRVVGIITEMDIFRLLEAQWKAQVSVS